jgi:quercetin dioxygenase-like cupin family protein
VVAGQSGGKLDAGLSGALTVSVEVVWMPGGLRTEIHLDAEQTAGAFRLLIDEPPAGWSLPPHRHTNAAETIHIIEGEFWMEIDGQRSRLMRGQTLHIPGGVVHSGGNAGATSGRRIVIFSPAGMEGFFREAGAPTSDAELDAAAALSSARRFGWEFIRAEPRTAS